MGVLIKICGLARAADAAAAAEAGATYGGAIFAPGSPRRIDPATAAALFEGSDLIPCGVFVNEEAARLREVIGQVGLRIVQLHGDETPGDAARLRDGAGVQVWKAIRPRTGEEYAREAERFAGSVDGLLLDGWSAAARGGTGVRFPWAEVARFRERLDAGVALAVAGGLTPDNVGEIVSLLAPDVVDVSSGVETAPGVKDPHLIQRFAAAAHAAAVERGVP